MITIRQTRALLTTASIASLAVADAAPAQVRSAHAEELAFSKDVTYRSGGDSTQQLDLYVVPLTRPGTPAPLYPTVVFIHGGSLTSGDKRDSPHSTICQNFVRAKVNCAAVNYRLVKQASWPAQPQDVAGAIAWIARNIAAHGGDPKRIYLVGHSSGCQLAALVATDTSYLTAEHMSPRDLAGVVAMGCLLHQVPPAISDSAELRRFFASGKWIYPSLEAFRDADPTLHVGPYVPSTLVLVAEAEQKQPPILENAQLFADRMRAAGRPVEIEILHDRSHITALTMMADPLDPTFLRILQFVQAGGTPR